MNFLIFSFLHLTKFKHESLINGPHRAAAGPHRHFEYLTKIGSFKFWGLDCWAQTLSVKLDGNEILLKIILQKKNFFFLSEFPEKKITE